jgi:hypothetical protein
LRLKNPHQFRPGEEFDPSTPQFRGFMEEILRRGGDIAADEDLSAEEREALAGILRFANRPRADSKQPDFGDRGDLRGLLFPRYCFSYAEQWRGNHPVRLNYEHLDHLSKTAVSCHTVATTKKNPLDMVS